CRYVEVVLDEPLLVHRAWALGTDAKEFGGFWSLSKPGGTIAAKLDNALLPEWGKVTGKPWLRSQATRVTTIELPKGTIIRLGETGPQRGIFAGGKGQLLIEGGPKPAWKVGTTEILK